MTQAVHDVYELNLTSSGKQKLRAKALLAEGTPDAVFRACVLLHEAARAQRRAVEALPTCPAVTLLLSRVEECWCFVEGRDPLRAAETWGEVLQARNGVEAATAESIVSRLAPRFEAFRQEFVRLSTPTLIALAEAGPNANPSRAEAGRARRELDAMLARFPGAVSFLVMRCRLATGAQDKVGAWDAIGRARQLEPGNQALAAISLGLAPWALVRDAAEQHLAGFRGTIERARADVCLMYALAEIMLARDPADAEQTRRWERARVAADAGRARARTPSVRRSLKAVQLMLDELFAGRVPTMDVAYRAGLGPAAAMERPDADVVDFLTAHARRVASRVEFGQAA